MIKKIDILGTCVDNYSVREAISRVEQYLNNNEMKLIETITLKQLSNAAENMQQREAIEALDLSVIGDREILKAAGIHSPQRVQEVQDQHFFKEFMERVIRNEKTIYLLAAEESDQQEFREFLTRHYEKAVVKGSSLIAEDLSDADAVINDINIEAPDVLLSLLPSPLWEAFILSNRGKLNAKIWYGTGRDTIFRENAGIRKLLENLQLKIQLKSYQERNG
ncbi:MAG: glycosyltransferase [Eubacterium sp.]|nr:glycosyltransferase [Eubacterium sp.]